MITSSGVPVSWDGTFVTKGSFADKFDVVRTNYDEITEIYVVTVVFKKTPEKEYDFSITKDKYSTNKKILATEILRQLQNES